MREINGKKFCPKCKKIKALTEFYTMSSTFDGYCCYCKTCKKNEYLEKQKYYCEHNQNYIYKNKIKAFQVIANGGQIKCFKHDEWNCCGDATNIDFLSFDHIEGDGANHRREIGSTASSSLHRWIIQNPNEARKKIQILCMNAQVKKKKENHEQKYERRNK